MLTALIPLTVVILMRVGGLILVIALLTLPSAIANLFTRDMRQRMALACRPGASLVL